MNRASGNTILKLCYDLCEQAKFQGIADLEQFDAWMDWNESEFAKRHRYVDEEHNEMIRRTCRKMFFCMLRGVPGFDKKESFSRSLEKVRI